MNEVPLQGPPPGSQETSDTLSEDAKVVKDLDADQFERLLRLRSVAPGRPVPPPPSVFGRVAHPATDERKLVLFTLAIVVLLLIITILVLVAWFDPSDGTLTALTTLAGTGLGFIGGMVSREKDERPTGRTELPKQTDTK